MTKRDAVMFSLYLMAIAMGVQMASHGEWWGDIQVALCSTLFGLRMYRTAKKSHG